MNSIFKQKYGITLIALVITIVILIILAGVTISLVVGDNGLLKNAKEGRNRYVATANVEYDEIAGITSDIEGIEQEDAESVAKLTEEEIANAYGGFVYYNVPYIDAYKTTYNYTASNGWRILTIEEDGDNAYNVEIISTGIPAKVNYYSQQNPTSSGNANYKWWGDQNDSNRVAGVNSYYGKSLSKTWNSKNSDYYFSYGLKYNFTKITFKQGIPYGRWSNSTFHFGYFNSINGITSSSSSADKLVDSEEKVLEMFKEKTNKDGETSTLGSKIIGIREVEYADIGNRTGKEVSSASNITTSEDRNSKGLFQLNNIKNNQNMSSYIYSSNEYYWLATPKNDNLANVWYVRWRWKNVCWFWR